MNNICALKTNKPSKGKKNAETQEIKQREKIK
jgi:hypothetical protein